MGTLNIKENRVHYNSYRGGSTSTTLVRSRDIIDSRTPIVKTPKKPWRPPTNYTRTISDFYYPYGYIEAWGDTAHTYWIRGSGAIEVYTHQMGGVPVYSFTGSLKKRAEIGALLKLKDGTINLAQAFGERAATARTVTDSAVRLAKAALAVKRGRLRDAANILGAKYKNSPSRGFANDWLAYKYGWTPLVHDAYGAVEALRRADERDPDRYTVAVKKRQGDSRELYGTTLTSTYGAMGNRPSPYTIKIKEHAFVRLDYKLENDALASLAEVGIIDPHLLAWELLPFSFVADWFVPVGDYLSALTADAGWTFKGGSCSQKIEQTGVWRNPTTMGPHGRREHWKGSRRNMKFQRTAYASSPVPSLYIKDPLGGLNSDNKRLLTAISLLTAIFHGDSAKYNYF